MTSVTDKPRIQCRYHNDEGWQCPSGRPRTRGVLQVPPPQVATVHALWHRTWRRWNNNFTNTDGHDSVGTTAKRRAGYGSPNFDCGVMERKQDGGSADRHDRSRQREFDSLT